MMRKTARSALYFICLFTALSLATQSASARHRKHKRSSKSVEEPEVAASPQPDAPIVVDHIDGNTVYFKATSGTDTPKPPQPMTLEPLSDLQPIGILRAANGGKPYYLLHARPCKDCRQEPAIFIFQAGNPKISRYTEPGRILDNRSKATVMEARAFYGRCLASRAGDVFVVFQKEKVDRRRQPQQSVLIVEPSVESVEGGKSFDHLHETLLERNMPALTRTLRLVKAKTCHEIDGRHRVMASHPVDVNLKRQKAAEEDDDDENDSPRENQTDRDYDGAVPASD